MNGGHESLFGRGQRGELDDGIAMIFSHHIYCAQSKVKLGGGGGAMGAWCEWETMAPRPPPPPHSYATGKVLNVRRFVL